MNILVTGGAGYIGSQVVRLLGQSGHQITTVDNLSTGSADNVMAGDLEILDLAEFQKLEQLFRTKKFSACLHFAASTVVPDSILNPYSYFQNNTVNTLNLVELCRKYHVNKFIFSSTAAVYGIPLGGVCSEQTATNPINPYGVSKLLAEQIIQTIALSSDLKFVNLRYFNVAGASNDLRLGQTSKKATQLIKVVSECVAGKRQEMEVFGTNYNTPDGTCIRDFIHIEDLAHAHIAALDYLDADNPSTTLNCGYSQGHSVKTIIEKAMDISNKEIKVKISNLREGDPPVCIADAKLIQKTLNWQPRYNDIEKIITSAIAWESRDLGNRA